jgi:hypothetical protein
LVCCLDLSTGSFGFAGPMIAVFGGIVYCSTMGKMPPGGK